MFLVEVIDVCVLLNIRMVGNGGDDSGDDVGDGGDGGDGESGGDDGGGDDIVDEGGNGDDGYGKISSKGMGKEWERFYAVGGNEECYS